MNTRATNKIRGALYGFAIGDAMGATTEFMNKEQIVKTFWKVEDIIGGGWLKLKAGEVTDDTQMMLCVAKAIMDNYKDDNYEKEKTLNSICANFIKWYKSEPKDIGNRCRFAINECKYTNDYKNWLEVSNIDNDKALGNGSLMRALVPCLLGDRFLAVIQGQLTHYNDICDIEMYQYYEVIRKALDDEMFDGDVNLMRPDGHVTNTLNNAIYWNVNSTTFKDSIIGAVNDGGDADTIAAITGSIAGAYYGFDNIPNKWINKLDKNVAEELEKIAKFIENI